MAKDTKAKILQQGLEIWKCGGESAVTVRAIARAVGIKAPSVLYHFTNAEDMRQEIARHAIAARCLPVILQMLSGETYADLTAALSRAELARFQKML